jgi:hypothetical protein
MHARHVTNAPRPIRQHVRVPANREGRRRRHIDRIQNAPDASDRWALFVARIAHLLDDDEKIDALLGALVEATPAQVTLYIQIDGARS